MPNKEKTQIERKDIWQVIILRAAMFMVAESDLSEPTKLMPLDEISLQEAAQEFYDEFGDDLLPKNLDEWIGCARTKLMGNSHETQCQNLH